jgi:hypothetical protein
MEPTLERRLRDADPLGARTTDAARDEEWLRETSRSVRSQQPRSRRPRLLLASAAAAAAVIAAAVGGVVMNGDDDGSRPPAAAPTVTELALPPDGVMQSCIPFSVETLAPMPLAFSGEVTERTDDRILITVDTWYRGGDTDQVSVSAPDMSMTSLGGSVDFRVGSRYLVTATDGTVNYCGFSGPWTQSMADAFAAAFGG